MYICQVIVSLHINIDWECEGEIGGFVKQNMTRGNKWEVARNVSKITFGIWGIAKKTRCFVQGCNLWVLYEEVCTKYINKLREKSNYVWNHIVFPTEK